MALMHGNAPDFNGQDRGGYNFAHAVTGLKFGSLRALVSTGQIPHRRIGPRTVIFERAALERWIKGRDLQSRAARSQARKQSA